MKWSNLTLLFFGVFALLGGCATTKHEVVTMKVSPEEAHVGLGSVDVKPGDRVVFFSDCVSGKAYVQEAVQAGGCRRKILGEGTIETVLNKDYSTAKVDPGAKFEEGTFVQKKQSDYSVR